MAESFNRTGYQLRKIGNKQSEFTQMRFGLAPSIINIDGVTHGLEGIKGNAHRKCIKDKMRGFIHGVMFAQSHVVSGFIDGIYKQSQIFKGKEKSQIAENTGHQV